MEAYKQQHNEHRLGSLEDSADSRHMSEISHGADTNKTNQDDPTLANITCDKAIQRPEI